MPLTATNFEAAADKALEDADDLIRTSRESLIAPRAAVEVMSELAALVGYVYHHPNLGLGILLSREQRGLIDQLAAAAERLMEATLVTVARSTQDRADHRLMAAADASRHEAGPPVEPPSTGRQVEFGPDVHDLRMVRRLNAAIVPWWEAMVRWCEQPEDDEIRAEIAQLREKVAQLKLGEQLGTVQFDRRHLSLRRFDVSMLPEILQLHLDTRRQLRYGSFQENNLERIVELIAAGGEFLTVWDEAAEPRLVGMAGLVSKRAGGSEVAELVRMTLDPEYRGKGVANHLLVMLMVQAKRRGFDAVVYDTTSTQEAAIKLYRRWGAIETNKAGVLLVDLAEREVNSDGTTQTLYFRNDVEEFLRLAGEKGFDVPTDVRPTPRRGASGWVPWSSPPEPPPRRVDPTSRPPH